MNSRNQETGMNIFIVIKTVFYNIIIPIN